MPRLSTLDRVQSLLDRSGSTYEPLELEEARKFETAWRKQFARRVRATHGEWIHGGFRWHGFSFGIEACVTGAEAFTAYRAKRVQTFVVFDEQLSFALRATGDALPDLGPLASDLYITDSGLRWTMAFTHESDFGPYFAIAKGAPSAQ